MNISGRDGHVILVRLRTQKDELLRPVQTIFPLEIKSNSQEYEVRHKPLRQVINEECEPQEISSTNKCVGDNMTETDVEPFKNNVKKKISSSTKIVWSLIY